MSSGGAIPVSAIAGRDRSANKAEGANPVYYVLGQTGAGRYLFCVVIQFPDGRGYPVTARAMTGSENARSRNGCADAPISARDSARWGLDNTRLNVYGHYTR